MTTSSPWTDRYATRTRGLKSSVIRESLKILETPDILYFGGGLPAPEVFPMEALDAAADRVLTRHGRSALQYGTTEGYRPLRELLVEHMGQRGLKVGLENVLVTSGAQQALDLVGKLLIDRGDRVLVEDPSYIGALQAFNVYGPQYLSVPVDDDGLQVDRVEAFLPENPKFLYVLPNYQNPGGVTLSLERRHRLLEIARRHGSLIVEDDPYEALRYEDEPLPSLISLASSPAGCGDLLYLGTFSKVLAPGLRIGWVVGPAEAIARLAQLKQGADLHTSTFNQAIAAEAIAAGVLVSHVPRIREVYRERRDAMLRALDRYFPAEVRWTRPRGGLFLWVTLPEPLDSFKLLERALTAKVAFVPGSPFHARGGGLNTFRLNFSYSTPEVIEEGMRRLGGVIAQVLTESSVPA